MAHKKKNAEPIDLSSSGVSTLSGSSSVVRKIVVFKNGDRFHRGVKFVINPKVLKDLETLLNQVNERIELSHGAKKLFSANGKRVRTLKDLLDGNVYVAVSNHFIPMNYGEGGEKIWKPPSRKASPIFREDRIRTARSQEPKQRRRETNPRSNSVKPVRSQATKPKIDIFIPGGDESRARKPTKKITTTSTAAKPKPAVAAAAAKKAPTRTHVPHKPVAKASPTKKMVKKAPTAPNKKPPPPPKSATPPAALKKHVDVETVHRTPTPERRHSESSSGHRSDSEEKISSKDSGRSLNSRDSSARSSSRSKSRSKSRSRSRSKSRSNSRHSSRSQKSSRSGSRSSRSRPRSRSKSKSRSRSRSHSDASRKSSSSRKAHEKS